MTSQKKTHWWATGQPWNTTNLTPTNKRKKKKNTKNIPFLYLALLVTTYTSLWQRDLNTKQQNNKTCVPKKKKTKTHTPSTPSPERQKTKQPQTKYPSNHSLSALWTKKRLKKRHKKNVQTNGETQKIVQKNGVKHKKMAKNTKKWCKTKNNCFNTRGMVGTWRQNKPR